ncbi:DUF1294 domain-containing protein [Pseudidiomarina donghaiensis]|uniref:DUF1294 domain-containing protein n=1 Tax=Pseudidiomarina donghaiensis TaxID=519452 RepID=A0A432XLQ6_9GAMM|nr:DUF1294 domain-containing protein [Pseudidiomarina donghaiensis]RUO49640.1 DUF1294 domain-containing protein [Pseudidiomarina donghaiensis]SFV21625.1 Uncharacterized membrane protein YsdA, DUF1294 family [Pseudidiomarina donghaiensis]
MLRRNGTVISWNADKGYGFIQSANNQQQFFAHITAFSNRRRQPAIGDHVTFMEQRQADNKHRAIDIDYVHTKLSFALLPILTIAVAYIAVIAYLGLLGYLPVQLWLIFTFVSVIAYVFYALDKKAALNNKRRTPEDWLQFLALMGGWPGALIAQQQFRHKTRKTSFRVVFYLAVLINIATITFYILEKDTIIQWIKSTLGAIRL